MPKQQDDFQRAAATAKAEAGDDWFEMPFREQAHAIYAQLRQIDAVRTLRMNAQAEGRKVALGAWAA
jgi:hypothetical protein